ncbi:hypothetical protein EPI10_006808 [Gossypium australe]|uniref:Uncharacterized protein n=1 Tax=Gossypium australe TaxID=47621 RepID=A0A5B6WV52_9ROSI|nr:hypothetical protein EPI10_006808 [Gossypium australe]
MPLFFNEKLGLWELNSIQITIQLAGRSSVQPKGVLEDNDEHKEKLGRQCFGIFVKIPNYLELGKVFPTVSVGRKSKFRKRDKRRKVEWHDGRWTNSDRTTTRGGSMYTLNELTDESSIYT